MSKSDQIKILNDKIKANNAQYKIDRLNAEISAFSEGDLDKYELLTRKDLKYKPNALDKAKFELSSLGKGFNQELDKKAENYKEEGVIKLLKDIRDKMVRPIDGNNDNRNSGGNNGGNNGDDDGDDDGDDYGNDDGDYRYGDEYLLKLNKLLNNLKNDKSEEEELDRLLKSLKDNENFLKTFRKDINDKSEEKAEELNKKFNILMNRKVVKEIIDTFKKK